MTVIECACPMLHVREDAVGWQLAASRRLPTARLSKANAISASEATRAGRTRPLNRICTTDAPETADQRCLLRLTSFPVHRRRKPDYSLRASGGGARIQASRCRWIDASPSASDA